MIITDASKRPSDRFLEVISDYFIKGGFFFNKAKRRFEKDFDSGKQRIFIGFLSSAGLVQAELSWGLYFPILEKVYSTFKGAPKKVDNYYTFGTSLNNLPEIRFGTGPYFFDLFDSSTLKYDDFSLNAVATRVVEAVNIYAFPFFETYKSLQIVERQLNKLPISYPVITNWKGKHVFFGLLLAWHYSNSNYDSILSSYNEYIESMNPQTRSELQEIFANAKQLVPTINFTEL